MSPDGSRGVVTVALGCSLVIGIAMLIAYAWTGASVMLAETVNAVVAAGAQGLLLTGMVRSAQGADARHPFGYAREIYFWSFVVTALLCALGAGVIVYEGLDRLRETRPLLEARFMYGALGLALVGLAATAYVVYTFVDRERKGALTSLTPLRDPVLFVVGTQILSGLAGVVLALAGAIGADQIGLAASDGVATVGIGMVSAVTAAYLSVAFKSLFVGESAGPATRSALRALLLTETGPGKAVNAINEVRTLHLGPNDLLVAASLDFCDGEPAKVVEEVTTRLERSIKASYPQVSQVFVDVRSGAEGRADVAGVEEVPKAPKVAASVDAGRDTAMVLASLGETGGAAAAHSDSRKARKKKRRKH